MNPNILFITVDDMNYNSTGLFIHPSVTPHIDKLTEEGAYFSRAHVNVSVCQPSRQCMMTGLYPHNNGSHGFTPIDYGVATLQEILSEKGYRNGIISKVGHLAPLHKYCWDFIQEFNNKRHNWGRSPEMYYQGVRDFLSGSGDDRSPFFLMVNSNDPHRPFAGSEQEWAKFGCHTEVSRRILPEEIEVPPFLPDLPEVRREVAQYYTSAHRADESVGFILKALEDAGKSENTIVIFLSDNGMAFPFAKTNCYLNSTKTPLIVKWPGVVEAGSVDTENFVTTVDFMPTILEIIGHSYDGDAYDGRSFLDLLRGDDSGKSRDKAFTLFNATAMKQDFEMRCVHTGDFGYIFNDWSDGVTRFKNESMSGLTFNAMAEEGKRDPSIQDRVDLLLYREKEELYDFTKDPDGLHNLAKDGKYEGVLKQHRQYLLDEMTRSRDPLLPSFTRKAL